MSSFNFVVVTSKFALALSSSLLCSLVLFLFSCLYNLDICLNMKKNVALAGNPFHFSFSLPENSPFKYVTFHLNAVFRVSILPILNSICTGA